MVNLKTHKLFWVLVFAIIIFGIVSRLAIVWDNRIFFTVDQGRDAIYVRQIINDGQIFTRGPETSVRGIFTGPLWYYFIAIGYFFAVGNPIGGVVMLIILNLIVTLLLIIVVCREVNWKLALLVGIGLQVFWDFFTTSLYSFNPFPLVGLVIIFIILIVKDKYELALIPILLAFNTELAGAVALLIFYILLGAWQAFGGKLSVWKYLLIAFGIPAIGIAKIGIDYLNHAKNSSVGGGLQIFAKTNFKEVGVEFIKMIGGVSVSQQVYVGFGIIVIILFYYLRKTKHNKFAKKFVCLSFLLVLVSYLFFGSNQGWRAWHTVYIPPLTFISLLFMLWEFGRKGIVLISVILILQIGNLKDKYTDYLKPSPNPSLLTNQLIVLDWIYTHNENNGFNLYTYTDSFYDYSYQYLVSWYGKQKYGFYPCEYANFPLSIKYLYIPGSEKYSEPKLGCDKLRFLIIDSATNGNENKEWINDFRGKTVLVEQTEIGKTIIEKRKAPDIY